ncbi:MAG: hypothetical protein ACXWC6_05700 [Ramlibacter sp.]
MPLQMPHSASVVLDRPGLGAVRGAEATDRKVLLTTPVPTQKTAWTKARQDVLHLLRDAGYSVLEVPASARPAEWLALLRRLRRELGGGGQVLIEYPVPQRKRLYALAAMVRLAGARFHALLHDLDSLRFADSPKSREIAVLRLFDGIVSHNPEMTEWLREGGIRSRVVNLNLFDYRCNAAGGPWHERAMESPLKVACCGNLSWDKARYIYDPRLSALPGVDLDLYGAFFEPDRMPSQRLQYHGAFDPDTPALKRRYHFGLVWDGTGVDQCEGSYGHYMRYNNPHKLSLYVAMGLPVIVWREAAIAQFVERCGIGVTVRDLRELGSIAQRVDDAEYRRMVANVLPLSKAARRGDFLHDALIRLQR